MKRSPLLLVLLTVLPAAAWADDRVRQAESQLKDQGFYYGEVDGKSSSELTAAVRRYQIRNGLEVTGELSPETVRSLGLGGAAPAPAPKAAPGQPSIPQDRPPLHAAGPREPGESTDQAPPPVNLRRDESAADSDRRILRQEMNRDQRDPSIVRPPASLDTPDGRPDPVYSDLFAGTPYASAPASVQQDTARRAQRILMERGFFRDPSYGPQGPALEEGILTYQRSRRLRLSGRLDLDTLAAMHLLPASGQGSVGAQPFYAPGRGAKPQVYRGVWVE
jgi:peptidoglycan hydrolase-like protein with peptidoglycan-binding domain